MFSSLATFLKNELFHDHNNKANSTKTTNPKNHIIYRDELSKTTTDNTPKFKSFIEPVKKGNSDNSIESSEPLINGGATIRVKVRMTKSEANRLLSKCKDGGVLEFRDVARELVNIPKDRVVVVSDPPPNCCRDTRLNTVPEEF